MTTLEYKEGRKRRYKRWLKKHPERVIRQLKKWVEREKDPQKLKIAKAILEEHLAKPAPKRL